MLHKRLRAMGTYVHLAVRTSDASVLDGAVREIDRLEQLWSRFIATSEVSRLNANRGVPNLVSRETVELVEHAIEGWRITDGAYDPTLLEPLIDIGYDRDFSLLGDEDLPDAAGTWAPTSAGVLGIAVRPALSSVTLNPVVGFDPGGIGKGFAADLVVAQLSRAGVRGALVNIGGDMRGFGAPPRTGWRIELENPFDPLGSALLTFVLHEGAIATTTSKIRCWQQGDKTRHHLIDPRTGEPSDSDVASVTVIADAGWRAEVLAKAAFIGGVDSALELLRLRDATGIVVDEAGDIHLAQGAEDRIVSPVAG